MVLEQYISQEEEFVVNFIKKPRLCYEACFSLQNDDRLKAVHPDGNLLVIVQEVSCIACACTCTLCNYVP